MVSADELWIGDWIEMISTGVKGQYHGLNMEGKVNIRTKENVLTTALTTDIRQIEDEAELIPEPFSSVAPADQNEKITEYDFGDIIDLHYEVLIAAYPHMTGSKLEYQLDICNRFIHHAIQSRLINIQIIHGRGQGILRGEVEKLLKQFPEVTIISANPNLSSVDAWFNYHSREIVR